MNENAIAGTVAGGVTGATLGGVPGALVGSAIGGLLGDAYSKKPAVGNFATTLQNDLAPENVTLDAHQIYVRITTGPGSTSLVTANTAADRLTGNFAERASQIAQARGAAAAAWQGSASTAAASATTPLADSFTVAQRQLAATAQALDAEVTAFDHIRSQVEPVPATPPSSGVANDVNPFQTDTDAAINEYNAKAAKNVALYEAYVAATSAARSQVPRSYAQPAPLSGTVNAVTRTASPVGEAAIPPPQVGSGGGGAGEGTSTETSMASGGTAPDTPSASGVPGANGGQGASASDPSARHTPSVTTPASATPGGVPLPPGGQVGSSGRFPSGLSRRGGTADTQRKFAGVGTGVGGTGVVPGGAGGDSAPRRGPSVTTGPVPGKAPVNEAAGRGVAGGPGGRGAVGPGGAPVGAVGRGTGEEDQEHRRRYRVEPDDKELFGLDEPYVPPVIGDHR